MGYNKLTGARALAGGMVLPDSASLYFGDGLDVEARWDGTDLDILAAADDSVIKLGNGTNSFDIWLYGNTANDTIVLDASANRVDFDGIDLRLEDSDILSFGDADDVQARWDGTDFDILAAADDSIIKVGNGTNSFDLWVYGNAASDYVLWDASAGKLSLEGDAYLLLDSYQRTITAKTADYTLTAGDSGGLFTTTGASGTVIFTLPAVAAAAGYEYEFVNTADVTMQVTAPANTLVAFNDAEATTISFETSSEKIGAAVKVACDGAKWIARVMLGAEAQTGTIS